MSANGDATNCEPPIKVVVFDFDGTLVDSNEVKRRAYDAAFEGIAEARKRIGAILARHPGKDRRFIIRAIVADLRRNGRVASSETRRLNSRGIRKYSRYCRAEVAAADDFAGVSAALRTLARDYRIAINSATPQRELRELIRRRRWSRYCDLVVGTPGTKAANLRRIARRFNVKPSSLVFVGDSAVDAHAAAVFGCTFIHAAQGSTPIANVLRFTAFESLPVCIARLNGRRSAHV